MTTSLRLSAPLAGTVLALALAAPASAGTAVYTVSATGNQETDWSYVKTLNPACDYPESAKGTQSLQVRTNSLAKKEPIKVKTRGGRIVSVTGTRDLFLGVGATQRRENRRLFTQNAGPGCDPDGPGKDGPAKDEISTLDCSVRGLIRLGFSGNGRSLSMVGTPAYGDGDGSSEDTLPAECGRYRQSQAFIGITGGQGEYVGGLVPATERVNVRRLATLKRGSTMTLSFGRVVKYPNAKNPRPGADRTTGQTVLALKVKLKRVR